MTSLTVSRISKSFAGVRALRGVSFTVGAGEIHALCGENGAGKSTLMNILAGAIRPDKGEIILGTSRISFDVPGDASAAGIAVVYQHLSLVNNLSVAENIFANRHPIGKWGLIDYRELYRSAKEILSQLQISIDARETVAWLSPSQRQLVEIAKALSQKPRWLILDEPTASLAENESKLLFGILRKLKDAGTSVIYISHRIEEIFLLADRITILKDGEVQGTFDRSQLDREKLIRLMVGRELGQGIRRMPCGDVAVLSVRNLSGHKFSDVSFSLHKGEIVGLAGLAGAGRTELVRVLFGADDRTGGSVFFFGREIRLKSPRDAVALKIGFVPEDRIHQGLFAAMSVRDNLIAAFLNQADAGAEFRQRELNIIAGEIIQSHDIVGSGLLQPVRERSGGNQQKVLFGKWISLKPALLIVDEPTHGVDVGAKEEIHYTLKNLAAGGAGVIVVSSEMSELLALCHRILVMRDGMLSGELSSAEATEEKILALATR